MADDTKPSEDQAARLEAETQDEIDKIMGEIEELRQEIGADDEVSASPDAAIEVASEAEELLDEDFGSDSDVGIEEMESVAGTAPESLTQAGDSLGDELEMAEKTGTGSFDDGVSNFSGDDDVLEEVGDDGLEEIEEETVAEVQAAVGAAAESDDLEQDDLEQDDLEQMDEDTSVVDEFSTAPEDEPSMDSTLADMPENAPAEGSSLIDQSLSDEVAVETENFVSEEPIDDLDQAMVEEASMPEPAPPSAGHAPSFASVTPLPTAGVPSSEDSTMTMTLSGKMSLRLKYEDSGHEVEVSLSQDGFVLRFGDGSEFRLPAGGARKTG